MLMPGKVRVLTKNRLSNRMWNVCRLLDQSKSYILALYIDCSLIFTVSEDGFDA